MAEVKRTKHARETVEIVWGKHAHAGDLADRFEKLATNPFFIRHLNYLRAFRDGVDPIPQRDAHEKLLRAVGHEFAAAEVFPKGGFLRNLLPGAVHENYLGLHGILAARLMTSAGALSHKQIVALYDTIDRIMCGGADWPTITRVQAVTAEYYRKIKRIGRPYNPASALHKVTVAAGTPDLGEDFGSLSMVHFAAIAFIVMAVTVKNGRSRVTADDGWEAAEAYLKLFEVDPLELPPLVREGRSGYEKA